MAAKYEDNCLCVSVPEKDAEKWINSELVALEAVQPLGEESSLRILLEKDFECLSERAYEDENDTFSNPAKGGVC